MKPFRQAMLAGLIGASLMIGLLGMADFGRAAEFPSRAGVPAPVLPPCTCRFQGRDLPLGARVCLPTPQGAHYAECVREINVTSWRPDEETCVLAGAAAAHVL
jgi:hypothetical protein